MQKKLLAAVFISLLLAQTAESDAPTITITEIGANEPTETEWIEITNNSNAPVDLTGWKFFEDKTNHGLTAFQGDAMLDPHEYALIANKADLFLQKFPTFTGTVFDSSWGSLKEEGEEIGLKDSLGNFVELFIYPPSEADTSLERIDMMAAAAEPANWKNHPTSNSFGQANSEPSAESEATSALVAPTTEITPCLPVDAPLSPAAAAPESPSPSPPPAPLPPPPPPNQAPATSSSSGFIVSAGIITKPPAAPIKKPAAALPTKTPTKAAESFELPEEALISLQGYFVFVPRNQTVVSKKTAKKTSKAKKSSQNKTAKKQKNRNGDLSKAIKITEVFPSPGKEDDTEEWLEIHNTGTRTINLGNWGLHDASKKEASYRIPETRTLAPGEYAVFPRSETHISLNNNGDTIVLSDFENAVIDSVTYEESHEDESYALIASVQPDIASLIPAAKASSASQNWEWTSEKTPGKANPLFESIEGTVSKVAEESVFIVLPNGGEVQVGFPKQDIDPLLSKTVLREGMHAALQVTQTASGLYKLAKIDSVESPPEKAASSFEDHNFTAWFIIALAVFCFALAAPKFIAFVREGLKARFPPARE